jgi:hypothetical protein
MVFWLRRISATAVAGDDRNTRLTSLTPVFQRERPGLVAGIRTGQALQDRVEHVVAGELLTVADELLGTYAVYPSGIGRRLGFLFVAV